MAQLRDTDAGARAVPATAGASHTAAGGSGDAATAATDSRRFGLDFIRAVAVSMVLVAHGSILAMPLWTPGDTMILLAYWGVELFFVLSGFLIGGLLIEGHVRGPGWVPQFWVRRWLRTLPNYYLFLALNVLFVAVYQGGDAPWPAYALFVQNLAWPHPLFFGEAWSLAVEEVFYLLAPLLAVAIAPFARSRRAALALFVAALAGFLLLRIGATLLGDPAWDAGVRKITLLRLDAIGFGVLAIYLVKRCPAIDRYRGMLALAGVLLAVLAAGAFLGLARDTSVFARSALFTLTSLAFALLLPWAARWEGRWLGRTGRRLVVWLAVTSYALYLTHMLVIRLLLEHGHQARDALAFAIGFGAYAAVSLLCAGVVYRWFEKPTLQSRDAVSRALFGKATGSGKA